MNTKSFRQISQRLLILTGALSIGALSVSPALANNHNNPMEPSSDTG